MPDPITIRDTPRIVRHVQDGQICCDPEWEDAYRRFETPAEEVRKFLGRLKRFGLASLNRDAALVEIFCGRGNGLVALDQLGFRNIAGVDLSDSLLEQYRGPATLHLADCLDLPFEDDRCDGVIVQGGLHHLPKLPDDLDRCLSEVRRVLTNDGRFYVVEPWSTPFLTFVHAVVERPLVRSFYAKGDAMAAMVDRERVTYEQWLGRPREILEVFDRHFVTESKRIRWGKLAWIGSVRPGTNFRSRSS